MSMRRVTAALAASALTLGVLAFTGSSAQADAPEPETGSCLQVPRNEGSNALAPFAIVPCDQTHDVDVYLVVPYPDDLGAPSTIAGEATHLFYEACSDKVLDEWLGATYFMIRIRVYRDVLLPSDEQWEAGARWVACTAFRLNDRRILHSYKGTLPDLLKSTPLIEWAYCLNRTPVSGKANNTVACKKKSTWLEIRPAGRFEAKVTSKYPRDLQAKADSLCARNAKSLLKKRSKAKAVAALDPKKYVLTDSVFAACFIPLSAWNGKAR